MTCHGLIRTIFQIRLRPKRFESDKMLGFKPIKFKDYKKTNKNNSPRKILGLGRSRIRIRGRQILDQDLNLTNSYLQCATLDNYISPYCASNLLCYITYDPATGFEPGSGTRGSLIGSMFR